MCLFGGCTEYTSNSAPVLQVIDTIVETSEGDLRKVSVRIWGPSRRSRYVALLAAPCQQDRNGFHRRETAMRRIVNLALSPVHV